MSKIVSSRIGDNLFNDFKKLVSRSGSSSSKFIEEIIEEELVEEELGIDPVDLHKAHTKLKGDFIKCGKIIAKQIKDIKSLEEELEYSKDLIADLEENLSIMDQTLDDVNYEYYQRIKEINIQRTKIEQRLVENLNDIERLKKESTKDLYKLCGIFGVLGLLIFVIF